MALVMIFAGSFLGLFAGLVQIVLHGAPIWHGFLIYMGCALGLPIALGTTRWVVAKLTPTQEPEHAVALIRH